MSIERQQHAGDGGGAFTLDTGAKQAWGAALASSEPKQHTRAPLQVGLLGVGRWGGNLLRVLRDGAEFDLLDWADLRASSMEGSGRCTLHELLAQPAIEAIVIATPAEMHFEHTAQALRAGRHVMVEKPLAHTVDEAEQLCALAVAHQRCLMVGHILRYHPAIATLRDVVRSGELGQPTALVAERIVTKRGDDPWWSLAPHDFSVAEYVLDAPICRVSCTARGDRVVGRFSNAIGVSGSLEVGVGGQKYSRLAVECTRGQVVFEKALHIELGERRFLVPFDSSVEPLAAEMQHFAACIRGGAEPLTDGSEGLRVVRVLAAGDRSRKLAGRWQDIK